MSTIDENHDLCCHLTPHDKVGQDDASFSCDMFSIKIVATFMQTDDLELTLDEEDFDESRLFNADCDVVEKTFNVERDKLMDVDERVSRSAVADILNQMGVPVQPFLIDKILNQAQTMARDRQFVGRKVLYMTVNIDVPPSLNFNSDSDGNGDDDEEEEEEEDDEDLALVPASKSSIEALEKVKIEGSTKGCSICLEEINIGEDATRLPCLHFYHCQCVSDWLEKSRFCPLCRFEIV